MRLWDYRLLKVLPNRFIVAQWRECVAIKRQWEKGTLKHPLVKYVMDYDKRLFMNYIIDLMDVMDKRNIHYQNKYYFEFCDFCKQYGGDNLGLYNYPEHNDRYLKQCFYNLEEKYDRGIISKEEFDKILELAYKENIIE